MHHRELRLCGSSRTRAVPSSNMSSATGNRKREKEVEDTMMELLQLSTGRLKRSGFHFPPVILLVSDQWIRQCCCSTSFFQRSDRCWLLLVAFFVRICGCMTWHKVWLSHIIKHPWKPRKLIAVHWEEWV